LSQTLPESASLPSAGGFAERFFFGLSAIFAESQIKNTRQSLCTRQRRLCRAQKKHSAKTLPSAKVKHSVKQFFKPCFVALNEFKLKSF
jgi:hypothetical protein